MPTSPTRWQAVVWQGTDCLLLARLRSMASGGGYITKAQLSSITLTVYDKNNGMAVVVGPISVDIASTVFDTLQQNSVTWPVDAIGYNFLYRVSGLTAFPNASDYRATFIFTQTDGSTFPFESDLSAEGVP